jgi:putative cardiolipin synthase
VLADLRADLGKSLSKELLIEAAYFLPVSTTDMLCRLVARGVHVKVLTNSLESTDEPGEFASYSGYRAALLKSGIELHELPRAANFVQQWTWLTLSSKAQLHTKTYVFDRSKVMIGSFNFDPRSANLNAEDAILVDSPALAAKVVAFTENGMDQSNSYQLKLESNGDLGWYFSDKNQYFRYDREPGENFWGYITQEVYSMLPLENLQ